MRRLRTVAAIMLGGLAGGGLLAEAAWAGKKVLILTFFGTNEVAPGERLEPLTFEGISFETKLGTVSCGTPTEFRGTDQTDKEAIDKVTLNTPKGTINAEGECPSTTGLGSATVKWDIAELWLTATRKVELLGTAERPMVLTLYFAQAQVACEYSASKLTGKLVLEEKQPLKMAFTNAKLKLSAASSSLCPKKAAVAASLFLRVGEEFTVGGTIVG
jgi:hypothetical protein